MDFETDKYDMFNAPQYVDFNEFVRNDGFGNDNADDFFETHREEDDFFPAEALSPTAQLLLHPSDIQIVHQEGPKSSYTQPSSVHSYEQNSNKSKYNPNEHYHGTGMSMSPSPVAVPRPTSSDLASHNQSQNQHQPKTNHSYPEQSQSQGQGEINSGTPFYYPIINESKQNLKHNPNQHQEPKPQHKSQQNSNVEEEDINNDNSQLDIVGHKGHKKWPIELTCSEEAIMKEEIVKTVKPVSMDSDKARRIAELQQIEKARVKAELEKAEKLRIQAELDGSEKLRMQLELENVEKARREAELARIEKIKIQAELERVEKARIEAEEKAERARIQAEIERQEKARIQAELERLERQQLQQQFLLQLEKDVSSKSKKVVDEALAFATGDDEMSKIKATIMSVTRTSEGVDVDGDHNHSEPVNFGNNNYDKVQAQNQNQHKEDADTDSNIVNQNDYQHEHEHPQSDANKKHYYYTQSENAAHPDYQKFKYYTFTYDPEAQTQPSQTQSQSSHSSASTHKVTFKDPIVMANKKLMNKVTIPQPFKFSELRPRKVQEAETDSFKFKARPAPLKAIHGDAVTSGKPLKVKPMQCTQPTEFHFASDDRIRERNLKRKSQPNSFTICRKESSVSPGMGRKSRAGRSSTPQQIHGSPNKQQKPNQSQSQISQGQGQESMSHGHSTETVGSTASTEGGSSVFSAFGSGTKTGSLLRKPRLRSRSSSVESAQRGFSPGPTTIVPFSFEERNKEMLKKKDEKIRNAIRAEIPLRNFHAQRVPNYALSLKRLPKKNPAPPTTVEPFHFKSDERGIAHQEEIQRKLQEEQMKLKHQTEFTAQPNQVIYKKPFEPERSGLPLVEPLDIVLNSDRRADDRAKFDSKIKEREAVLEEQRKQEKYLKEEHEIQLSQKLRQMCVHHAKPAPKTRFFEVKSSEKPLTEPRSPAFELLPSQRRPRNYENKENVK